MAKRKLKKTHRRRGGKTTEQWFYLYRRREESDRTQNDTKGGKKIEQNPFCEPPPQDTSTLTYVFDNLCMH